MSAFIKIGVHPWLNPNAEVGSGLGQRSWTGARVCDPQRLAGRKKTEILIRGWDDVLRVTDPRSAAGRCALTALPQPQLRNSG